MRLFAKTPAYPSEPLAAGLWFEYIRLFGTATVFAIMVATLLHGCYCELSKQSTYWGTAGLIVAAGLCVLVALWRTPREIGWATVGGVLAVAWLISRHLAEVYDIHQVFLAILSGISAGALIATVASQSPDRALRMSAQKGPTSTDESLSVHRDVAAGQADSLESHSTTGDANQEMTCKRSHRGKWLVAGLLMIAFLVYMIVVPVVGMLLEMWTPPRSAIRRELTQMSWDEYLRLHTVSGVMMTMFLAMGASVGSFLNVVIFRSSRGRALLWPPSACAACGNRISGSDNIPILAWLNLSGKCRHCGTGISMRYPMVEALVAAVFVLFFYRELLSGGENLPVRTSNVYKGIVWILFYTKWDLLSIYVFHMFVLTCLLCWGMINLDRFRVPKRMLIIALVAVVSCLALAPHLNPLLANGPYRDNRLVAVANSLMGAGIGGLFGWLLARLFQQSPVPSSLLSQDHQPNEVFASEVANADIDHKHLLDEVENASTEQSQPALTNVSHSSHDLYGNAASSPCATTNAAAALAVLGAAFGHQAALCVGLVTFAIAGIQPLLKLSGLRWPVVRVVQAMPVTLILFGVAIVHLAFWNAIHIPLPHTNLSWLALVAVLLNRPGLGIELGM